MLCGARTLSLLSLLVVTLARAAEAQPSGEPPSVEGSAAVSREVSRPELVEFVRAEYPAEARAQRLEANVGLMISIDAEGKVKSVEVVEPAGHGFDEAAVAAAKQFVYKPARRGDHPIAVKILYRYPFVLEPPLRRRPNRSRRCCTGRCS